MKNSVLNLIKYFLKNYPYKSELSASRLTKLMYLADWKSAIDRSKALTDVTWHFNHYGPYVDDFIALARKDEDILIESTETFLGGKKQLIKLKDSFHELIEVTPDEKKILDFVIFATKDKNYEDFIRLVYSTYPVVSKSRYSDLDLVALAKEYKEISANAKLAANS